MRMPGLARCFAVSLSLTILVCSLVSAETVKGTRVQLDKPEGFTPAPSFSGYIQESTGSSIMVTEMPAPFDKATAGFNAEMLATRGMKLLSSEKTQSGAFPAILLSVQQNAYGTAFKKWMLAFGDQTRTIIVAAQFPVDQADKLSEPLKAAVMSAKYDVTAAMPDPQADLGFSVAASPALKFANRIQNALLFTPTGQLNDGDGSLFIIAESLGSIPIPDKAVFARRRLSDTRSLSDVQISKEAAIKAGGLPAYEIVASATDKSRGKVFVIQTIAFTPGGGYFIMQGTAPVEKRQAREGEFRAMVNSFKPRTPAPAARSGM